MLGNRQNQATRRLGEHGAKQPSEPKANQGKRIGVADVVECPLREKHIDLWLNGTLTSEWLGSAGVLEPSAATSVSLRYNCDPVDAACPDPACMLHGSRNSMDVRAAELPEQI
ncbi:hypothetical protein RB213_003378 [Colletotrichum asianum]